MFYRLNDVLKRSINVLNIFIGVLVPKAMMFKLIILNFTTLDCTFFVANCELEILYSLAIL